MRFKALLAENFMSFEKLDFTFPASGLFLVTGEIAGKSESSNGSGKSTIFEALCWGLFGKTIRNSSKDDIINRKIKRNCVVTVVFEGDDAVVYTVVRARNHSKYENTLHFFKETTEVTGADVFETQNLIDYALGMNWLTFSTAVIFGQKATRFAEAGDREKKEIFDKILMLDIYQEALEAVKADVKKLQEEVSKLNGEKLTLAGARGNSEANLERERKNLQSLAESKDIEQQVKEVEKRIVEQKAELELFMNAVNKAEAIVADLDVRVMKLEEERVALDNEKTKILTPIKTEYIRKEAEAANTQKKLSQKERFVQSIDRLIGTDCPTCGQLVTPESKEQVSEHYFKEIEELKTTIKELSEVLVELDRQALATTQVYGAKAVDLTTQKNELSTARDIAFRGVSSAMVKKRGAEGEIETLTVRKKMINKAFEADKKSIEQRIDFIESKLVELEEEISVKDAQIFNLQTEGRYLQFWIEGFGNQGIKSFLLDEVLPDLNTMVSYFSSVLTDGEHIVEFDTEKALKTSGEKRDKFDVRVVRSGEPVDYSSCSGGEKRRIDVAILLSLQGLIFKRAVSSCNLVVLDEVFESLDTSGIERVVSLLSEESKERAIFVITHQSELKDFFDNILLVRKNAEGISTLVETI